ncbi:hypothetical protein V8C26DRAFT_414160 [Trichoderma gracile]
MGCWSLRLSPSALSLTSPSSPFPSSSCLPFSFTSFLFSLLISHFLIKVLHSPRYRVRKWSRAHRLPLCFRRDTCPPITNSAVSPHIQRQQISSPAPVLPPPTTSSFWTCQLITRLISPGHTEKLQGLCVHSISDPKADGTIQTHTYHKAATPTKKAQRLSKPYLCQIISCSFCPPKLRAPCIETHTEKTRLNPRFRVQRIPPPHRPQIRCAVAQ